MAAILPQGRFGGRIMCAMLALIFALLLQDKLKIEKGEKAPAFDLKNQDGKSVKLEDYKGKKNVLLAFYPKDFTGG
jgi:cytochrome oxidase Cu insertion factor (SCO1/SenC/PrrC family)